MPRVRPPRGRHIATLKPRIRNGPPMARGAARVLEGVAGPILAAVVLALLLDLVLEPPRNLLDVLGRAFGFALAAPLPILLGAWLGHRSWPRRGRKLARHIVRRQFRKDAKPLIFLTDRPDFAPNMGRRVLEVIGFSAGSSVLLAAILPLLDLAAPNVLALASLLTLLTLWGSFVLVPYWLFARMGLRQVDAVRWLVQPMSRGYADRLRLSNGALLLFATGAVFNLAFRAGQSGEAALVDAVQLVVRIVASVLVTAATATAFYARQERKLLKEFEEEVVREHGIRDGRGMSDGDFLPKLPPPAVP